MSVAAFGGFARGLAAGIDLKRDRETRRGRGVVPESKADTAALDRSAAPAGSATAENGWKTADPVAPGLAPYQRAFLNAVAAPESGGDYNVRYGGEAGPQQFDGFDKHPGVFADGPEGPSSAAGRYQFTKTTWDDTGGGAFTPAAQDTRAWDLAAKRYKGWSGRDLGADLQARGLGADILSALTPTWQGFKNQSRAIKAYDESMARYGSGASPAPAAAAPAVAEAPAKARSLVGTLAGNFKANVATARENIGNIGTPGENWRDLKQILGG